nr:SDR family NAD(P)-dependent oxidoreductase [Raoultella terrigena]
MKNEKRASHIMDSPFSSERRRFLAVSAAASVAAIFTTRAIAAGNPDGLSAPAWGAADIPPQTGRTIVITGGNGVPRTIVSGTFPPPGTYSGLGFQDALALAGKGANVIIASRNAHKGQQAVEAIAAQYPEASVRFETLDLADLRSVQAFSERLRSQVSRIDVLINNAATAGTPEPKFNADGLELCWATNVVGHYSLTAHLLPLLQRGNDPRVVFLSSSAARRATMRFDDLQTRQNYTPLKAYSHSKLAILILARELNRQALVDKWGVSFIAAHPGVAKTFLIPDGPGPDSDFGRSLANDPERFKPAAQGALSTLYAATAPAAKGGIYYGPVNDRGDVGISEDYSGASGPEIASRLYDELVEVTAQRFS